MVYRKRILISFLGILIVPILVNNVLLFKSISDREMIIKREYIYGQVKQLRGTVDYLLNKLQSDFVYLSYKEELRNLRDWYNRSDYRQKREFFSSFDPLSILAVYYDEAFIIHPDDDIMLDLKNKLVSPIRDSRQETKAKAIDAVVAGYPDQQQLLLSLTIDGVSATYLIRSLPISETGKRMLLFIQFSDTFFKHVLDDTFLIDESFVLMLNQNEALIEMRAKDLAIGQDSYSRFIPISDFDSYSGFAETSSGTFLVCYDESSDNGWKYFYGISLGSIQGAIAGVLVQFSLLSIVILGLFMVVVRIVSRNIYKPVMDVMELLKQYDSTILTDEFSTIQVNIEKLIVRNQELRRSLDQNNRYERDDFLHGITAGQVYERQTAQAKIAELGLDILTGTDSIYAVTAVFIKNHRAYGKEQYAQWRSGSKETALIERLTFPNGVHFEYFLVEEKILVFILSVSGANFAKLGNPEYLMELWDKADTQLMIGVGAQQTSLTELYAAYKEARIAIEYRTMFQNRTVVSYQEVISRKRRAYFYPADIEQKILSLLKQLDKDGVLEQFSHFTETVSSSAVSFPNFRHIYFHLLDSLMQVVKDFDIALEALDAGEERNIWDALEESEKPEEIVNLIGDLIEKIIGRLQSNKEAPTATIAHAVKTFIDRNYKDKNLSLDLISGELKYSISHLSSIFKDVYGETIKNYITGLRLTKARDLLINSDMQISRISEEVGYDNIGSFVKIFKAYIGDTPKEYRLRIRRK